MLVIVCSILLLATRTLLLLAVFFKAHDQFITAAIILGITSILVGLIVLTLIFVRGVKRNLRNLVALGAMLLVIFFFPFEYVFGWTLHQFSKSERKVLVTSLTEGRFDGSIQKNDIANRGTWISAYPRIKVFKDSAIQLIFITKGDITCYDFYGSLFISDPAKIDNHILSSFLSSEFNKWRLSNNWYLVECYTDTKPGP